MEKIDLYHSYQNQLWNLKLILEVLRQNNIATDEYRGYIDSIYYKVMDDSHIAKDENERNNIYQQAIIKLKHFEENLKRKYAKYLQNIDEDPELRNILEESLKEYNKQLNPQYDITELRKNIINNEATLTYLKNKHQGDFEIKNCPFSTEEMVKESINIHQKFIKVNKLIIASAYLIAIYSSYLHCNVNKYATNIKIYNVLNKEIISDTTEYSDELPNNEANLTTEVFYSSWEPLGNNQYYRYARSYIMPFYSNDLQKYSEVDVDDISPYIIKDIVESKVQPEKEATKIIQKVQNKNDMKTVKNLEYFCIGFLIYGMSATVVTYFLIKANKKQARMINSLNNICDNVNNILKDENDKVNIVLNDLWELYNRNEDLKETFIKRYENNENNCQNNSLLNKFYEELKMENKLTRSLN